jgi:hypothetical protein
LIRFPPHKQISATLFSDTTYFKLRKEGVLVSLRAWNGDVEPYDTLDVIWVQIKGVPPKWSNWKCFRQIAFSLGKMIEIDWNSLFSSFFSMVRVRIVCKDPNKISDKRLFEMDNNLYLIHFKVESALVPDGEEGIVDKGDDEGYDNEDDTGIEEFQHEPVTDKKINWKQWSECSRQESEPRGVFRV